MAVKSTTKWHALAAETTLNRLRTTHTGLISSEAKLRLDKWGENALPRQKPYSKLRLFLNQFNNPLIYIIFGTIIVSLVLRHYTDTVMIVLVLLSNTLVGFYQENKANSSVLQLKKLVQINARVIRDGNPKEVNSRELVMGDVIVLHPGDKVPADARILEAKNFKVNEANLTGESAAVKKHARILPAQTILAERANQIFMGTLVEEGSAQAVVVGTGLNTQLGKIVTMLAETEEPQTPLQSQMAKLARLAATFVIGVILLILIIGWWRFEDPSQILLASLSLAVSAIPSGLLPAITLILVLGMRRILHQKGLVRKLVSTETLGSVTVICTDKTGTLTEGRMSVTHLIAAGTELSGKSLQKFNLDNPDNEAIKELGKIATLSNDAYVENPNNTPDKWVVRGKITDQALLRAGALIGFNKSVLEQEFLLIDKIHFSSSLKYSATLREIESDGSALYVIGAPEVVMQQASSLKNFQGGNFQPTSKEFKKLQQRVEELAGSGLRVLAAAEVRFPTRPKYKNLKNLVKDLTLVGLIALEDPVRAEAVESIKTTRSAGIKTIIVTGDHKLTALAVAGKIGLPHQVSNVIDADELETLTDAQLKQRLNKTFVFARVAPEHKLRIVALLQSQGEIVAMVGDGINDAPALKSADIGVAVSAGTDVAREVADLILLDNGFHSIVKSIEQGRVIFSNIRKVFIYLIADDFSELFIFLASMLMGLPLPLLPAQILWINLVEDGLPDLALTTEQETDHVMRQPPRLRGEPILTGPVKRWLACIFVISGLSAFLLFFGGLILTDNLDQVRTMVFALMGFDSLVFVYSARSLGRTVFRRDIFSNKLLVGATLISLLLLLMAIYAPFMHRLLATVPLSLGEWLIILLVSATEIILIESAKEIFVARRI